MSDSGVKLATAMWNRMLPPVSFDTVTPVTSGAIRCVTRWIGECHVSERRRQHTRRGKDSGEHDEQGTFHDGPLSWRSS